MKRNSAELTALVKALGRRPETSLREAFDPEAAESRRCFLATLDWLKTHAKMTESIPDGDLQPGPFGDQ